MDGEPPLSDPPGSPGGAASSSVGLLEKQAAPARVDDTPQGGTGAAGALPILSLVFSVLGLGLVGVVLGHVALGRIGAQNDQRGRGPAIAGLVLGYLGLAVLTIWIVALLMA
ncbi:MAG: DUF4190 domain-containing protein [Gordonia sp. (in: high G+C Gram-positive bacteria)]